MLGSASPRRAVLLRQLTKKFDVIASNVDEALIPGDIHVALCDLAHRKASAVHHHDQLTIAADTEVIVQGLALGKPQNHREALRMLQNLNQTPQTVVTAVAVVGAGFSATFSVESSVKLDLTPDLINRYVDSDKWVGKAGGYGIQDSLIAPHAEVFGSWSNVIGLPLQETADCLRRAGLKIRLVPEEDTLRDSISFDE